MFNAKIYSELKSRWLLIQDSMQLAGADGCLIGDNVNLFYLTNRIYNGYCYIPAKGEPHFFVRRPVGLKGDNVHYIRKPEQISILLPEYDLPRPKVLMLEKDDLSYSEINRLQNIFRCEATLNASDIIRMTRSIKSDYEISLLRKSAQLHVECYAAIQGLYRPGMTDIEFSIEIERLFRKKGSIGHFRIAGQSMEIFMGSVIAGENACEPSPYDFAMGGNGRHSSLPVGGDGTVIEPGMAVMVDMGGTFTGYISDMTRVFSLGKLSQQAYDAHQVALEIQNAIREKAKPGVATSDLYETALDIVKRYNLMAHFMGFKQQAGFVGHGVGLQINEAPVIAPRSKDILQKGNVFALEPKFVIPGTGAVGIENTFVVNDHGIENLTEFNEEIIEL